MTRRHSLRPPLLWGGLPPPPPAPPPSPPWCAQTMHVLVAQAPSCWSLTRATGPATSAPNAGGSAGDESWDNPGANEAGGDGEAPELTLASDLTDQWVLPAGELLEQDSDAATLGRVVQITSDEMPLLSLVGMSARCAGAWGSGRQGRLGAGRCRRSAGRL